MIVLTEQLPNKPILFDIAGAIRAFGPQYLVLLVAFVVLLLAPGGYFLFLAVHGPLFMLFLSVIFFVFILAVGFFLFREIFKMVIGQLQARLHSLPEQDSSVAPSLVDENIEMQTHQGSPVDTSR